MLEVLRWEKNLNVIAAENEIAPNLSIKIGLLQSFRFASAIFYTASIYAYAVISKLLFKTKINLLPAGALIDVNGAFVIPLRRLFVRIIQKIQSGNRLYVTLNLF